MLIPYGPAYLVLVPSRIPFFLGSRYAKKQEITKNIENHLKILCIVCTYYTGPVLAETRQDTNFARLRAEISGYRISLGPLYHILSGTTPGTIILTNLRASERPSSPSEQANKTRKNLYKKVRLKISQIHQFPRILLEINEI